MKCEPDILRHIAIIMDGNGRWAETRGLPRKMGHREGVKVLIKICEYAFKVGIPYVTVFAFSTENKNRPKEEVDALIGLMRTNFKSKFGRFVKKGIRVKVIGDTSFFPKDVSEIIAELEHNSNEGKNGVFTIALNYGGRAEIVRAVNAAVEKGEKIDEQSFKNFLYTKDLPDPDIILRTSGEMRLSNFLLYQSAYSELYFTKTLWPDFTKEEFDEIVRDFLGRVRRYGKVK